jgi:hypothetical protein
LISKVRCDPNNVTAHAPFLSAVTTTSAVQAEFGTAAICKTMKMARSEDKTAFCAVYSTTNTVNININCFRPLSPSSFNTIFATKYSSLTEVPLSIAVNSNGSKVCTASSVNATSFIQCYNTATGTQIGFNSFGSNPLVSGQLKFITGKDTVLLLSLRSSILLRKRPPS